MTPERLFALLCAIWAISQLWIGRRRSGDPARRQDQGTLRLLIFAIAASLVLGTWLAWRHDGQVASPNAAWLWTGMATMLAGLLLRWWSVRTLAQDFTVDIAVRPGQSLVGHGPYRWLRHPSYTGALLTVLGYALALGQWLAGLVVFVPITVAFLWRIRIEERMLAAGFPDTWPEHARRRWRLLPLVW